MHRYLYLVVAALVVAPSITAEEMSSLLGSTLSEALYLAEELPSVNKPNYLGPNDMAVSPDHATVYVTAEGSRELLFVDLATQSVSRRVELPASPTGLTVAPDGGEIYVTCMSELLPVGVVAVVSADGSKVARSFEAGHSPRSPVISPDGSVLYVCNRFVGKVSAYSSATGAEKWETDVVREPYAMEITPDGGTLVVANYLPAGRNNVDTLAAAITFIETTYGAVDAQEYLFNGAQSLRGLALSDDGTYAYVTFTKSLHTMTPLNRVDNGWINSSEIGVLDVNTRTLIGGYKPDIKELGTFIWGFANPWGAVVSGNKLIVAGAGNHELHVAQRDKLHTALDSSSIEDQIFSLTFGKAFSVRGDLQLKGPRAVVALGDTVLAAGYFSDEINIVNIQDGIKVVGGFSLHPDGNYTIAGSSPSRQGEHWFNNAREMCFQGWHSCQSCHPEGRVSGMKWDLENDGQGNFKDTRSTLLAHLTPPLMITGVRDSLGMVVRKKIELVQFWDPSQLDDRATLIEEYIASLRPFPSPSLTESGLSQAAVRGKEVFQQLNCGECHPEATYFTDMKRHEGRKTPDDIGRFDGTWDTPTLHELWRTAPYGYNGSCATLQELFYSPYNHGIEESVTDQQISDLVEYLLTL